jgi:hypothetical protein
MEKPRNGLSFLIGAEPLGAVAELELADLARCPSSKSLSFDSLALGSCKLGGYL